VLLGAYSSEDWLFANHLRKRHLQGETTVQIDITWLVPITFKLAEWAAENCCTYTFLAANRVIVQDDHGILKVTSGRGKIEVEHVGDPEWVRDWMKHLDAQFKRAENLIQWMYSTHGDEISVPLNFRPTIRSAYPWIQKDLHQYIDEYLNSEANVLILIGPPGTGKTTLIKNLIHRSGGNAMVAYDEKVMMDDSLFATFISADSRFLIMEDADAFLQARTDGNTMMHRFLNVSDGLISAVDKKLVFSTNLPNITDIDAALMRPGRCFDVLEFRPLTRAEAQAVVDETGHGELPAGKTQITLAEIFSQQPSASARRKGAGFI
jgi:molybdopterin-guanine dinucleotide biosynthesis protein